MTEAKQTNQSGDKGIIAQAQERVAGTAGGLVETIKANPKTAAAIAVGAAAAVAGVAYRDKVVDAVASVRSGNDGKTDGA